MKRVRRIEAYGVILCMLFVTATIPNRIKAYSVFALLDVPQIEQQKSYWCWAASGAAVASYMLNQSISQQDFSYKVKNNSTNNDPATLEETKFGLSKYGIYSTLSESKLSYSAIKNSIKSGKPIVLRWGIINIGGHQTVLKGFHDSEDGVRYVFIMDPGYATMRVMTYDSACNHTVYSFEYGDLWYVWDRSLHQIRK